jgi:hypothetical protein
MARLLRSQSDEHLLQHNVGCRSENRHPTLVTLTTNEQFPHWWPRQRTSSPTLVTPATNIDYHIGDYQLCMEAADSSSPTAALRVIIWLPTNKQAILAGQPEGNLNAAACCADCIYEVTPQPLLASVAPNAGSTALLQGTEDLSHQAAALSTEQDRFRTNFRDPCPSSRNPCYSLHPQRDRPREQLTPTSRNSPSHSTNCHATTTRSRDHINFSARSNL